VKNRGPLGRKGRNEAELVKRKKPSVKGKGIGRRTGKKRGSKKKKE